ncbi:glycoside hydrolase [Mucilaginibacter xinganensis]|uniref:Beta-glycosidase n=1 Tax=Mucilaginibacter xinganensis TaxID=1234841 RepID=A0A223NTX1_9SPHI|nr:glycoside hydrolase [Mucilaginibacter xinganensis]ASU32951.1 beta-glycosidase [Mucilaginibacter xinganensis]
MYLSARSASSYLFSFIIALFITKGVKAQSPVTITIDLTKKAQTIQNFGASGCWFSDPVGKYWADSTKERMAELLFSRATDKKGNPKGIGLSAWRFNIGAGTAEQGDSSGIKDVNRRVECFLNADGTYSWNKEQGYVWFLKKAKAYGVENLIAFVNSPPVYYTQNGLGFKTTKDHYANLKADKYKAYADFTATVLAHFNKEGLSFNYISPVNEPQWDWYNKYGEGSQEGSPYTNKEIFEVVKTLNVALDNQKLSTKILIPEAGMLTYLYNTPKGSETGSQVQAFWQGGSPLYLGDTKHMSRFVAGHGYFTEAGLKNTVDVRQQVADTAKKYGVEYWQSEYSMLADGFKEGNKTDRSAIDCAIFLAKLIHYDLTVGNASAWQFWNSYEPGKADFNTRYYLLALDPSANFKSGNFRITKNLWALGHYSRFIRPGMVRLALNTETESDLLTSAFYGDKKLVLVMVNNSQAAKQVKLDLPAGMFSKRIQAYLTTAASSDNMKACPSINTSGAITIQPRAIYTLVINKK